MSINAHFSQDASVFHGRTLPEKGFIVGYAAVIHALDLPMPMPRQLALISKKNRKYRTKQWIVFPPKYQPRDAFDLSEIECLYNHLVFAFKYEGVNLLMFSFLIQQYNEQELSELVSIEPTGQYSRRIWFLIEWLSNSSLPGKKDLTKKSYIPLIDDTLQYCLDEGEKSSRHLVINNLPGTRNFCPLIHKTEKLDDHVSKAYSERLSQYVEEISSDLIRRTASFLLLKDSRASFQIEGEVPRNKRAFRWGQAIGQAGNNDLDKQEIIRLQQIVIKDSRFIDIGFRKKGGFVGEHDRMSGQPIPEHISARWQDLDQLINGLIRTNKLLIEDEFDSVLAAACIAFGFVFIHPLEDGNGRLHRYLIHHVLKKKNFSERDIIFPISASMLNHIEDYRKVLQNYSTPLLEYMEWKETSDHNVEVLNDTINYYRFFDATAQAEFLYDCVKDTIEHIIPSEIEYLRNYDSFKTYVENKFSMPDSMIGLLVQFLRQNNGTLSKRAMDNEFAELHEEEVVEIEHKFIEIFLK